MTYMPHGSMASPGGGTPISPGQLEVSQDVEVTFAIER